MAVADEHKTGTRQMAASKGGMPKNPQLGWINKKFTCLVKSLQIILFHLRKTNKTFFAVRQSDFE